jgi:hypothetical protein
MEYSIPILIEKLASISQAGLTYSTDPYDRARFSELEELTKAHLRALSQDNRSHEGLYTEDEGYRTVPVETIRSSRITTGRRSVTVALTRTDGRSLRYTASVADGDRLRDSFTRLLRDRVPLEQDERV